MRDRSGGFIALHLSSPSREPDSAFNSVIYNRPGIVQHLIAKSRRRKQVTLKISAASFFGRWLPFIQMTTVFEKSHAVQSDTVLVGWETLCSPTLPPAGSPPRRRFYDNDQSQPAG